MAKSTTALKEVVLTVGALLGVVCFVFALCAIIFGITPLVFSSGSMSPTIETGSLALARTVPATSLSVGDVVSVDRADGSRITHRVAQIGGSTGNSVSVLLKGDANLDVDPDSYVITEADRVFAHVPYGGYIATWTATPSAWGLGAVLAAGLIYFAWRPKARASDEPTGKHSVVVSIAIVAVCASVVGAGFGRSDMTEAVLTDTVTARPGNLTAGTLANPTGLVCTGGPGLVPTYVTLTMPRPAAPVTGYQVVVRNGSGTPMGPPTPFTVPTTGAAFVQVNSGLLGALLGGTAYADVRSVSGQWISNGRQTQTITSFLGTSCSGSATTANNRLAVPPSSTVPESSVSATTVPDSTSVTATTTTTGTSAAPTSTTTTVPPTTSVTTTESTPAPAVEPPPALPTTTTTTTPPAPVDLISPQSSPSGSAVAKVVSVDGAPTLQITDASGEVLYSGPVSSSDEYGYGVVWAAGDQLWLLGPSQLVRLDSTGSGWSRSVVDPAATEDIPAEIAARLN